MTPRDTLVRGQIAALCPVREGEGELAIALAGVRDVHPVGFVSRTGTALEAVELRARGRGVVRVVVGESGHPDPFVKVLAAVDVTVDSPGEASSIASLPSPHPKTAGALIACVAKVEGVELLAVTTGGGTGITGIKVGNLAVTISKP